jgi:transcription elongation factor Elf1
MTTRERIDYERSERDAIAWDQYKADMRYWDDARPNVGQWSCESCGHSRYSEHHSILGGTEQHWVTCEHCGAAQEFPVEQLRKPMQFELLVSERPRPANPEPGEDEPEDDWPEAA